MFSLQVVARSPVRTRTPSWRWYYVIEITAKTKEKNEETKQIFSQLGMQIRIGRRLLVQTSEQKYVSRPDVGPGPRPGPGPARDVSPTARTSASAESGSQRLTSSERERRPTAQVQSEEVVVAGGRWGGSPAMCRLTNMDGGG